MDTPLVSILMPAFNAERWIAAALQSALRQTWQNREVIVVDDGSTDRTLEIAQSFKSEGVVVVRQDNQGGCVARNRALEMSRGDYIQWLDADDLLAPDKIERQLRSVGSEEKDVLLSSEFGRFYHRHRTATFTPNGLWTTLTPTDWLCRKLGKNLWMTNHSWLVSRELSEAVGPWDETLLKDQDGEYACRLMLHAKEVRFVPGARCYYRTVGFGSVSHLGQSREKLQSQLQSLRTCIGYLQSREDSERTRAVAVNLLNDWAHHFYPHYPELLEEMRSLAERHGGKIADPKLPSKYRLLESLLGFERGRVLVQYYNRLKTISRMKWDQLGYQFERIVAPSRLSFSDDLTEQNTEKEVVFIPFDGGNPYQTMLAEGLAMHGWRVIKRRWLKGLGDELALFGRRNSVVHLHWLPSFPPNVDGWWRLIAHLARLARLRLSGSRFVWTVHNLYSHERKSRLMEWVLIKFVMRISEKIVVHAPTAKELLEREFGSSQEGKVVVIPHGNYLECYPNLVAKSEARRDLGLGEEGLGLLFLGNIRPYKGVEQLLAAYRGMTSEESFLLIAGHPLNGSYLSSLEKEVLRDPRVRLHPKMVADERVQHYMNACELVVFPYRQVLTSGAVVLAMSFGKACIAPRLGCIPDMLDERGAFLYDPDEPEGLRKALADAVAARGELVEMGLHNLSKAKEWGWDGIGKKTMAVYGEASGEQGNGSPVEEQRSVGAR